MKYFDKFLENHPPPYSRYFMTAPLRLGSNCVECTAGRNREIKQKETSWTAQDPSVATIRACAGVFLDLSQHYKTGSDVITTMLDQ